MSVSQPTSSACIASFVYTLTAFLLRAPSRTAMRTAIVDSPRSPRTARGGRQGLYVRVVGSMCAGASAAACTSRGLRALEGAADGIVQRPRDAARKAGSASATAPDAARGARTGTSTGAHPPRTYPAVPPSRAPSARTVASACKQGGTVFALTQRTAVFTLKQRTTGVPRQSARTWHPAHPRGVAARAACGGARPRPVGRSADRAGFTTAIPRAVLKAQHMSNERRKEDEAGGRTAKHTPARIATPPSAVRSAQIVRVGADSRGCRVVHVEGAGARGKGEGEGEGKGKERGRGKGRRTYRTNTLYPPLRRTSPAAKPSADRIKNKKANTPSRTAPAPPARGGGLPRGGGAGNKEGETETENSSRRTSAKAHAGCRQSSRTRDDVFARPRTRTRRVSVRNKKKGGEGEDRYIKKTKKVLR
ncbi:hypothetical protein FB451DRAFT_1373194 [Mycena latifolia]|nr:hypothetical protein FB451DRAFT_1373194 [Mycena latifolia]